jgi:replicative DNA helicase
MNNQATVEKQLETIKKPPLSIDAERSVLGSIIINNDSWSKIEEYLNAEDFYLLQHRTIFQHMKKLTQKAIPFDVIILSDSLNSEKLIDKAGGLHYLADLAKNTPTALNIIAYANIVKERSKLRILLNTAIDIANMVYSTQGRKIEEILDLAEQKILAISKNNLSSNSGPKTLSNIIPNVIDRLDSLMESSNGITGLPTGFYDLDQITAGLHPSNLIIIAGRPSMGKTAFAMNLAENVAKGAKKPVLIFSLEMPSEDIVLRMLSSLGSVEQRLLRTGQLNDNHWLKITSVINLLSKNVNISIDDSPSITPNEMRSRARRIFKEYNGLSMIVLDYLQLMKAPEYENNRTQEVSEISRSLKSLAKELDIPVIAISQLNRSVDDRSDKRPMMSDLRESGAIEQDADVIMFVYRDEVYNKNTDHNKGISEIIIAKQRNCPIGKIKVHFEGHYCRFSTINYKQKNSIDKDTHLEY